MAEGTHVPGVMVSSTCYDLRQIREDLRRFLQDDLGYRPLLSEHPSFPLNPDANTVENCRERVERDADILVLVIGGRYGTVDDSTSKSLTNLEYLGARQKGIPVYVFIEQGILPLLPVWKSNRTADFTKQVDTPELFEFIEQLRSADKVWTQEFKHARDIIDALRIQFAYQHREGLLLRRRVRQAGDQDWLRDLHGQTLRIALEKQPGWEYRLFAHALIDATDRHYRQRHRHETGIPLGLGEDVKSPVDWLAARFSDAQRMAGGLSALFSGPLQVALGPPGTPGDAKKIVLVSDAMGDIYGDALRWSSRVRAANLDARFDRARAIAGKFLDDLIGQIQKFGPYVRDTWETAVAAPSTGTPRVVEMTLTISVSAETVAEFNAELARLRHELQR